MLGELLQIQSRDDAVFVREVSPGAPPPFCISRCSSYVVPFPQPVLQLIRGYIAITRPLLCLVLFSSSLESTFLGKFSFRRYLFLNSSFPRILKAPPAKIFSGPVPRPGLEEDILFSPLLPNPGRPPPAPRPHLTNAIMLCPPQASRFLKFFLLDPPCPREKNSLHTMFIPFLFMFSSILEQEFRF